jgi:hypothetical protein
MTGRRREEEDLPKKKTSFTIEESVFECSSDDSDNQQ